ncbi:autolysin, partial [Streptococcus pneumoniae]|nr:autolysin [Streptococcus pneumoniae]
KEEFMTDYRLYIELLRNLADEAGLPKTLDTGSLAGIKTHEYCTNNQPNNHSDHVDPYPYLAKWGISREQFKHDIENGLTIETGWQKNDTGYWYVHSDGSYPKDKFEKVNDTWYYLDAKEGAMVSNVFIQSADGTGWYYLKPDGTLADKPDFTVEPDGLITVK